jgi:hypothetical protein
MTKKEREAAIQKEWGMDRQYRKKSDAKRFKKEYEIEEKLDKRWKAVSFEV